MLAVFVVGVLFGGCGSTRWTNTSRTATEQLLLSDAMDRAVSQIDFRALAGRTVYLNTESVNSLTDAPYLVSTFRQQLLASGCIMKEKREEADYVVEVRAGAVGTDQHDILFGIPATQLPSIVPLNGVPTSIPEIPLIKKTHQRGVVKIAVFAYNRNTGRPAWQSGVVAAESKARSTWFFGAGPFQQGNIYEGTTFAGSKVDVPLIYPGAQDNQEHLSVADEAFFVEPTEEFAQKDGASKSPAGGQSAGTSSEQASSGSAPPDKPKAEAAPPPPDKPEARTALEPSPPSNSPPK